MVYSSDKLRKFRGGNIIRVGLGEFYNRDVICLGYGIVYMLIFLDQRARSARCMTCSNVNNLRPSAFPLVTSCHGSQVVLRFSKLPYFALRNRFLRVIYILLTPRSAFAARLVLSKHQFFYLYWIGRDNRWIACRSFSFRCDVHVNIVSR